MGTTFRTGRDREIAEIVRAKRAALVGRLLLGELNRPLERIFPDSFAEWPRLKLRRQRDVIRAELRGEIAKFCQRNFRGLNEQKLADLYEALWKGGGKWRLPLVEFQARFGVPNDGVLRGAPLHATVSISHWGLQTEYPEHHLSMDLAEAVNSLIGAQSELAAVEAGMPTWSQAKRDRRKIGSLQTRLKFHCRMALVTAFNLLEAYLNGLAWQRLQLSADQPLSENDRRLLAEDPRPINLRDKVIKYPRIIKGVSENPLHDSREPLKTFLEIVKPFRDSVVHASPFSAPEKFGGYDKLDKIYSLDATTALKGVDVVLALIREIHQFLGADGASPAWLPCRDEDGRFLLDEFA